MEFVQNLEINETTKEEYDKYISSVILDDATIKQYIEEIKRILDKIKATQ